MWSKFLNIIVMHVVFFRWRRPNGFILAGILIVLGLGSLVFGAIHQRSRYNETKDYEEGTCKNVNKVQL